MSGGGDKRLNQMDRIIPHAFLDSADENKWTEVITTTAQGFPNIRNITEGHLGHRRRVISPWSSWSETLDFCRGFSRISGNGFHDSSRLAILDITRLPPGVEVWEANNPAIRTNAPGVEPIYYADEYLVYGPVHGDCLHTVSFKNFDANHDTFMMTNVARTANRIVRRQAPLLASPRVPTEAADVIIYVTAIHAFDAEMLRASSIRSGLDTRDPGEPRGYEDLAVYLQHLLRGRIAERNRRKANGENVRLLAGSRVVDTANGVPWMEHAQNFLRGIQ